MTSAGKDISEIIFLPKQILCKNLYYDLLAINGIRDLLSKFYLVSIQSKW